MTLIPILLFASIVVFLMIHLIPGDAASAIAGPDATPEALAALREKMGLNEPLYLQYWIWLRQILNGDLGVSNVSHLPVAKLIASRLPATLELTAAAILFAVAIANPGRNTRSVALQEGRRPCGVGGEFDRAVGAKNIGRGCSRSSSSRFPHWLPPGVGCRRRTCGRSGSARFSYRP